MDHYSSRPALRSELFILFVALTLILASVAILARISHQVCAGSL